MATKRPTKTKAPKTTKTAPKSKGTPSGAKTAGSKAPAVPLQAELLSLDGSYEEDIDIPVATIQLEGRELEGIAGKLGEKLLAGSRLAPALLASLGPRLEALDATEAAWSTHRTLQLPTGKKQLRVSAEELRSDVIAALRHFVPKDVKLQAQVTRIVEGSDLADLIDDLKKLHPLVIAHASALTNAELPANVGAALLDAAKALETASSELAGERAGSDEGRQAQLLRNRAYWHLRAAIDEIRECGRYAFRKSPELAKLFRSSYSRKNKKHPSPPAPTT